MTRPTPPEAPLPMPVQNLRETPPARFDPPSRRVRGARFTAFGGALALTLAGGWHMRLAFGPDAATPLQLAFLAEFAVAFGWIAFSATSALAGLLFPPPRPGDAADAADKDLAGFLDAAFENIARD